MDPITSNYTLSYQPPKPWSKFKNWFTKPDPNSSFGISKKLLFVLGFSAILLLAILSYILFYLPKSSPQKAAAVPPPVDNRAQVQGVKSQQSINREFAFPLRDDKGKEVAKIKYVVENAELRDEILVKGQKATAIKGKTFLIINLRVTNEYTKPVEINTRDYIRFVVGENTDQQAADIHNDPVVAQADATKLTRIGLTIDDKDLKRIKLLVGEIKSEKQSVDLQF